VIVLSSIQKDIIGIYSILVEQNTRPPNLYTYDGFVLNFCRERDLSMEHRLRVFENRMLRGIFGSKRDEVMGGLRKLLNEEPHNRNFTRYAQLLGLI
jgi:hypothetical protein